LHTPDTTGPSVFILIPVHNRRLTTLACLRRLRVQGVFNWARIVVVDDGSTDGTGPAVCDEFPEVRIIVGDGRLYWTGAIELGMRRAMADGADFVFWLNDDCIPEPVALPQLLSIARSRSAVAGGVCVLPRSRIPVYGGFRKRALDLEFVHASPDELMECDALNGNIVCLPRAIIAAIGYPDGRRLPHALGDTDYTLRARAAGFPVLLAGSARADALPNNSRGYASWLLSGMGVRELWSALLDPRAYGYLPADVRYRWRHWGLRGIGVVCWSLARRLGTSVAILLLPLSSRRRWWGSRSEAWRRECLIRAESGHV
jgi:hypothetical protein